MKDSSFIIISCIFLTSCVYKNKQQTETFTISSNSTIEISSNIETENKKIPFWTFDVTKEYPTRDFYIQDIADVEYLPIETNDSMLWQGRDVCYVDNDIIIAANNKTGVLFHERKTGKALNSFNRKGSGPEEYRSLYDAAYDKNCDEVFILDMIGKKYFVYDKKGNFKRSFATQSRPYSFFLWHQNELIEYVAENTYIRRNRKTGEIIETYTFGHDSQFGLRFKKEKLMYNCTANHFIKDKDGYILSAFASDTTWLLTSDMVWKAIGVRTPSILSMERPTFILPIKNSPNYYFMCAVERSEEYPTEMYMLDKNENQIYWLKSMLKNKDFLNQEVHLDLLGNICDADIPVNMSIQSLGASGLIKANENGRLSGELKDIAAQLKEEDNPVLMIIKFR